MVDSQHGGLLSILSDGKNIVSASKEYYFFEPVYALGINPSRMQQSQKPAITEMKNSQLKKIVQVKGSLPSIPSYTVTYTLFKKEGRLTCHYSFDKTIEKDKESLHIAFPFNFNQPAITFGSGNDRLRFNTGQLAGSNKEFVCVEKEIQVQSGTLTATLTSPLLCLYEIGNIIDENKTNGVKTWKTGNNNTATLFLYVFNNYWHTNFKAYQEGHFDFEIELSFNRKH